MAVTRTRVRTQRRASNVGAWEVPVWVAMVVTLGLVAVSAGAAVADRYAASLPGPVLLVGDSLFFQSAEELQRALEGDGWDVDIVAYPGAGLGGGGYVSKFRWGPRLRDEVALVHPRVAVIELGTNGCVYACDSIGEAVDSIVDSLEGVDLILWLTVRTGTPRPRNAADINDGLEDAAGTIVDMELLPYDRWFVGRSELIRPDGIHLTPQGQRAMAHRVRGALRDRADVGR
jgi:hypothetical protein